MTQGTTAGGEPTLGEHPRFRITAWPGQPVPIPPPVRMKVEVLEVTEVDFLHYIDRVEGPDVELPEELVLRELFALDTGSADELAAFTQTYGLLTTMLRTHSGEADPYAYLPATETYRGPFPTLRKAAEAVADAKGLHPDYVVPAEGAATHARVLRALVRQWAVHAEAGASDELITAWKAEGFTAPRSVGDAWRRWEEHLNSALRPYQVHVRAREDTSEGGRPGGVTQTNAYTGMAAQLANLVAEAATWRHCANENCQRMFVRQRGRSEYGQHRSRGVLYCTPQCARAQGVREYRRRKRAKGD